MRCHIDWSTGLCQPTGSHVAQTACDVKWRRVPSMSKQGPVTVNKLLKTCYSAFFVADVFSFAVNLLMLTMLVFMFQVFDRGMASGSMSSLFLLLLMVGIALAVQAALDSVRAFSFARISGWMDRRARPILLSSIIGDALDRESLAQQPELNLIQGMPVTAVISAGDQTLLEYILAPISRSLEQAFKEN
jgi:ABC-type protease/lipase transport system fused ATPase/permease subunit